MSLSLITRDEILRHIASVSQAERAKLKQRAICVLERVRSEAKHRLRSKVEDVEVAVAIETIVQVEAADKVLGKWFAAKRRLQLNMKYFK